MLCCHYVRAKICEYFCRLLFIIVIIIIVVVVAITLILLKKGERETPLGEEEEVGKKNDKEKGDGELAGTN